MKKLSSAIVKMVVVLVAVFSVMIAANAAYVSHAYRSEQTAQKSSASTEFYAAITIHLYQGEGCGCVPLREVFINATGRDTDHSASNVTDQNGMCILFLEYDKTYRLRIEQKDYESVLFDFVVLDDQTFSFHVKEVETSAKGFSLLQMVLQKILLQKN
jgi:hypothetical protein